MLLTIAGLDPSSGAGITADLKVFAAHRYYGVSAVTALTVQSTAGVRGVDAVGAGLLEATLACLAEDLPLAGIKIGMLASGENVEAVARFLGRLQKEDRAGKLRYGSSGVLPIVLDPVLRSSSGHLLLEPAGLDALRTRLLPLVGYVTPNTEELPLLLAQQKSAPASQAPPAPCQPAAPGQPATPATTAASAANQAVMLADQAAELARQHPRLTILVTGGHLATPDDYVLAPEMPATWLPGYWVDTRATHGTGCAYSSALLCGLVAGLGPIEAARAAKLYVTEALQAATPMGTGGGSMHHLYRAFAHYRRGRDESEGV